MKQTEFFIFLNPFQTICSHDITKLSYQPYQTKLYNTGDETSLFSSKQIVFQKQRLDVEQERQQVKHLIESEFLYLCSGLLCQTLLMGNFL